MNGLKSIQFPTPVADDMVRAIMDDRKTETRRVVKPQPEGAHTVIGRDEFLHTFEMLFGNGGADGVFRDWIEAVKAPYWPGDILYVRETWCLLDADHMIDGVKYAYKANATPESERVRKDYGYKWRPSIHMPREAARIFLRVTDVRVERLQDIDMNGCIKEGIPWQEVVPSVAAMPDNLEYDMDAIIANEQARLERELIREGYGILLWDSTIKPADRSLYGWDANPWVWVINFERIHEDINLTES